MTSQTLEIRTYRNWREGYLANRYLEFCTEGQIKERLVYLLNAITRIDHSGNISYLEGNARLKFEIRLANIAEELKLRGIDPNEWIEAHGHCVSAPVASIPTSLQLETASKQKVRIYKYGKQVHLDQFLNGDIRFTRASKYAEASLTSGQRDKELEIRFRGRGDKLTMEFLTGDLRGQKLPAIGGFAFTEHLNQDYFVTCFTLRLDQRFVSDFEADAILIIDDVFALRDRLEMAIEKQYCKRLHTEYGVVEYVDIFFPRNSKNDISFQKHIQYYYQQEYRIALFPLPKDWIRKPYFNLRVGSLRDIARLISL